MAEVTYTARLKARYLEEVRDRLQEKHGYKSPMEIPRLLKVTLNMGVGEAKTDSKVLDHAVAQLAQIAGQQPIITSARRSIAGFKIREGMPIGAKVTLRGDRMYEFLDRLMTIAHAAHPRLPRASTPTPSTGGATSPSASGSRSSSRRSTTTQSTRCGGWTWRSPRAPRRTTRQRDLLRELGMPFRAA